MIVRKRKRKAYLAIITAILASMAAGCATTVVNKPTEPSTISSEKESYENVAEDEDDIGQMGKAGIENAESVVPVDELPEYTGTQAIIINNNTPYFDTQDPNMPKEFLELSELDELGRCGVAFMCVSPKTLPKEERGEIGMIKPSGWNQAKYPEVIEENPSYLWNRSHLLAFSLSGINADERNLITGTRAFNAGDEGMFPYEMVVLDYVRASGNHVWYRVTPIYDGDNLVAKGVLMEAQSIEDNGSGICFNVFVYNIQPGIGINYMNGDSWVIE